MRLVREEFVMRSIQSWSFLRRVLLFDAVSSGAMGLAAIPLSGMLATVLGLPVELLVEAGIVLVPFAAFVGFLATRAQPARTGVWVVIALNIVWVLDSIVLLLTGWVAPNALGYAFVIGQAVAVAVLAGLEYIGLRRSAALAA